MDPVRDTTGRRAWKPIVRLEDGGVATSIASRSAMCWAWAGRCSTMSGCPPLVAFPPSHLGSLPCFDLLCLPAFAESLLHWRLDLVPIRSAIGSEQEDFFERKIRPVLVEHCYECHAGDAELIQGGLRLDDPDSMLRGGDSGAAVMPGEPDKSLLLAAIRYDGLEMPPEGPLGDHVVQDFETWIKLGAVDPREADLQR